MHIIQEKCFLFVFFVRNPEKEERENLNLHMSMSVL